LHLLKMNESEEAKIKYRVSTDPERIEDINLFFVFDESLKGGPGVLDLISYEEGLELQVKGYTHTMARLKTEEYAHLIKKKI